MDENTPISFDRNILVNAHGPYSHGRWQLDLLPPSTEASYADRSEYILQRICSDLISMFSADALQEMSILDVGCYDGWMLHQISTRISMKRYVAIEPRTKNIDKGEFIRKELGVQSKVEFAVGSLDTLDSTFKPDEFDIVLCLGVIHHVESTPYSVRVLTRVARQLLIIDSLVIDEPIRKERILRHLNPKDIIYSGNDIMSPKSASWGIAAFKFESPYFDGSAYHFAIVNIPEVRLLEMSLMVSGFERVESGKENLIKFNSRFQKRRGYLEAYILARPRENNPLGPEAWIRSAHAYELIRCTKTIAPAIISHYLRRLGFLEYIKPEAKRARLTLADWVFYRVSLRPNRVILRLFSFGFSYNSDELQLLMEIHHDPVNKVLFELAKFLLVKGELTRSKIVFEQLISKQNADWRTFYRSVFMLNSIQQSLANHDLAKRYDELLRTACPDFPLKYEDLQDYVVLK